MPTRCNGRCRYHKAFGEPVLGVLRGIGSGVALMSTFPGGVWMRRSKNLQVRRSLLFSSPLDQFIGRSVERIPMPLEWARVERYA